MYQASCNTDVRLSSLGTLCTGAIHVHCPTPAQSKSAKYFKQHFKDYVFVSAILF